VKTSEGVNSENGGQLGNRAVRGRFFGWNRAKGQGFEAKNRNFPVIFRGQILRCGIFWAEYALWALISNELKIICKVSGAKKNI
jgi:hypothetical protein